MLKNLLEKFSYPQFIAQNNFDRSLYDFGFWSFFNKLDKNNSFSYLSLPMAFKSQRENWYQNYIAEFICFASNLPILAVGFYDQSLPTIFAGLMSAVSHSIPTQFAHDLDMLGVAMVGITALYNYSTILSSPLFPIILISGALAISINIADTVITRKHGDIVGPWLHAGWHLTAAFALHNLNESIGQNYNTL